MIRTIYALMLAVCSLSFVGCQGGTDAGTKQKEAPAKVAVPGDEQQLATITLTPKAKQRLGIRIAETQLLDMRKKRTFGGEVVVPPGRSVVISAPIAGTLLPPNSAPVPAPGSLLSAGQTVFRFKPLLTPAERVGVAQTKADLATAKIEAARSVESAKLRVEAAQIAYDRTLQLLKTKSGSQRSVDEAQTNLQLAREALTTANARNQFLSGIELDEGSNGPMTTTITAPVAGVLQSIDVAPNETVTAGTPLFHVVTLDRVWIRVPIYVGHWRDVDTTVEASIAEYGQSPDSDARTARYISAPPSANAAATTVDLFYELKNDAGFYPGQKLAVTLQFKSQAQSLVVPWAAVLYDIHGGAWVYEQVEPQVFVRRRIEVKYVDGTNAVLAAGPKAGTKVVTDGAAELFGTEFGVGK